MNPITEALNKNLPKTVKFPKPTTQVFDADTEEDYIFAKENIKHLIENSTDAITTMMELARDSEHPRAFEVLANLLKTATEMNLSLLDLQKDRKKLLEEATEKPKIGAGVTNNNVFIGSTSELQKLIKEQHTIVV